MTATPSPTESSTGGAAPVAASSSPARPARPPRRWADLVVVSLLSAGLAAGGTYAALELGQPGSTGSVAEDPAPGGADVDPGATPVSDAPAADPSTGSSAAAAEDWAAVAEAVTPSTVTIAVAGATGQGSGSGVVWDTEGHVVTNAHVVQGARQVQVSLADGRTYPATVVGTDPSSDLAVLQLTGAPDDLPPIAVGDDRALQVGDPVLAVGSPLGLSGTVTSGIVSALDRPVTTQGTDESLSGRGVPVVTNAIQTSAAINPGNSGGALVNAHGELVGINSSIASLSQAGAGGQAGSIGIGFAIPAVKVSLIAEQLIETGTATHAFLGVGLVDGSATLDGALLTGAEIRQVEDGSPAAEAGLRTGDVVVAIDGEPVSGLTALIGQVRERAGGQQASLTVVRDGERQEVAVTFATRADEG